jgi:hypothetical protein
MGSFSNADTIPGLASPMSEAEMLSPDQEPRRFLQPHSELRTLGNN